MSTLMTIILSILFFGLYFVVLTRFNVKNKKKRFFDAIALIISAVVASFFHFNGLYLVLLFALVLLISGSLHYFLSRLKH